MDMDWITKVRLAGEVTRMHVVPTLRRYNVAEHSFNAVMIAKMLCKLSNMADHDVVNALLLHDLPESYTGDIPANVKYDHPELKTMLDTIEKAWWERNDVAQLPKLTEYEDRIVRLADSMELVLFCMEELQMGNRRDIIYSVISRACNNIDNVRWATDADGRKFSVPGACAFLMMVDEAIT